jgi:hypothetical protein
MGPERWRNGRQREVNGADVERSAGHETVARHEAAPFASEERTRGSRLADAYGRRVIA